VSQVRKKHMQANRDTKERSEARSNLFKVLCSFS